MVLLLPRQYQNVCRESTGPSDKSFDFVIASHVLEHSSDPELFLSELQRVARAGYIETPDAFMERINPYWDHRSEITVRNGVLEVRKKKEWKIDDELVEMYEDRVKKIIAGQVISSEPFIFHTRFFWQEKIHYHIVNPETDSSWPAPHIDNTTHLQSSVRAKLGRTGLAAARLMLSQKQRNQSIKLNELLQCPNCSSLNLIWNEQIINCKNCHKNFKINSNVPHML